VGTGQAEPSGATELVDLYDRSLSDVYGYLVTRCGSAATAEDLTAETFLAAVDAVRRGTVPRLSTAWLIGVARHKLADHWRLQYLDERTLQLAYRSPESEVDDPWDAHLDAARAHAVLGELGAHHRAALTFRYLDGLSVPEVAEQLGRTVHATEALLVRARAAFRAEYGEGSDDG
jgi:RNA polymerase sigma-70 factor (ECF subfamily)